MSDEYDVEGYNKIITIESKKLIKEFSQFWSEIEMNKQIE